MIRRTLLTALLYLSIILLFIYCVLCFIHWEIIFVPCINEWTNEQRGTFFLTYVCLCPVSFMVETEINNKRKRLAEDLAKEINNNMFK